MSHPESQAAFEEIDRLLELVPDAAIAVDRVGRILAANSGVLPILDYQPAELRGESVEILLPERLRARHQEERARFMIQPHRREMAAGRRLTARTRSGSEIDVLIALTPFHAAGESFVVAALRDVSAITKLQNEIVTSRNRYQSLFQNSPAGLVRSTRDGEILDCNRAAAIVLGCECPQKLVGDNLFRFLSIGDRATPAWPADATVADRRLILSARPGDQPAVTLMVKVNEEPSDIGSTLLWTILDVTAEERALGELKESREQFRTLVESVQAVFWRAEPNSCRFLYISPGVETAFGYPAEDWLRDPGFWPSLIADEERETILEFCRSRTHALEPHSMRYRLRRANGQWAWIQEYVHVVHENGEVKELFGFLLDITERQTLEHQLRQAQKMEAIGRLAGGIAHDFNNLLAVIGGYAELLATGDDLGSDVREGIDQIRRTTIRASQLTAQLLAFGRKQVLRPQPLDLNFTLAETEKLLRRVIGAGIEIRLDLGSGLPAVFMDPVQLEQIVLNLAINARDAMPEGGVLTIRTRTAEAREEIAPSSPGVRGPVVALEIGDTGCGMDTHTASRIFEPFFTTKAHGKGTGLGLATVYGIVRQSNGEITVNTEVGHGTTFEIRLPTSDRSPALLQDSARSTSKRPESATLLLVEDEDALRELLQQRLTGAGYRVLAAATPSEALAISSAHADTIDAIITDIMLPEMSGDALAGKLRASRPEIRVLRISGYPAESRTSAPEPFTSFLQKPFSLDDLEAVLLDLLETPPRPA